VLPGSAAPVPTCTTTVPPPRGAPAGGALHPARFAMVPRARSEMRTTPSRSASEAGTRSGVEPERDLDPGRQLGSSRGRRRRSRRCRSAPPAAGWMPAPARPRARMRARVALPERLHLDDTNRHRFPLPVQTRRSASPAVSRPALRLTHDRRQFLATRTARYSNAINCGRRPLRRRLFEGKARFYPTGAWSGALQTALTRRKFRLTAVLCPANARRKSHRRPSSALAPRPICCTDESVPRPPGFRQRSASRGEATMKTQSGLVVLAL
jgi:hypothetical protein